MLFRQKKAASEPSTAVCSAPLEVALPVRLDEITLGVEAATQRPFTFPRKVLGNMHVRGMSGSGKTSLTLLCLIAQLMGFPIFIIDLGGDTNMFHTAMQLTLAAGKRFRYLTLDPKLDSFCFPPFQTIAGAKLNTTEISQRLVRAFNLVFGAALYGATYFAAQALAAMLSVAANVFAEDAEADLAAVDHFLNRAENKKAFRDAESIRMNVRFLRQFAQLSRSLDVERNIIIERAIEESEVNYFFCPTLDDPIVAPLVGGLALATLIHVASERAKAGATRVPIYIIIDEFAEIVGASLSALLTQGRKYGLRFILANQSTSQLETTQTDLKHVVFEGTTVKQYFTSLGDDVEVLQSLSKDKIRTLGGTSVQGLSSGISTRDTIVPSLERDEVLEVSQTFGQSFLLVNDGNGFRGPTVIEQAHQFPDLSHLPMPKREATEERGPVPAPRAPMRDVHYEERAQRLRELLERKQQEEHWELRGG